MRKKPFAKFPTSASGVRLAAIMHRQPTTPWSEKKEIKPFLEISKHIREDDLLVLERYYRINWPPRTGHNHLRHDLATLINNYGGEVDRARIWCDKHPPKSALPPQRKIIPLPMPAEQQMSEDERARATAEFEKLMGRKPKLA